MKECHKADRWVVKMLFKLLLVFVIFLVISGIICYLLYLSLFPLQEIARGVAFIMNYILKEIVEAVRFVMK
jgi:putative flippase GtrA